MNPLLKVSLYLCMVRQLTENIIFGTLKKSRGLFISFFLPSLTDCVRAEPVIYKKLESLTDDVALLRAYVGDRPTWRNPHHPWRVDSKFKLTGVPSLILWKDGEVKGRLEDHEAHVERKIDALLAAK